MAASSSWLANSYLIHRHPSNTSSSSSLAVNAPPPPLFSSPLPSYTITLTARGRSAASSPHIPCLSASRVSAYEEEEEEEEEEWEDEDEDESTKTTTTEAEAEAEAAGRLYVGNLPYSMTPSQLSQLFSEAGSVHSVEIVYDRVTDRSRGFAFVTMASSHHANQAIRMFDGSQVGGRTVKVNFPEVPRGGEREVMGPRIRNSNRNFVDSPYKVYAGNLGWTVTSDSLRLAFGDQPGLLGARVVYDRDSGKSRGFGFVSFDSPQNARSAIANMDAHDLEGRPLRLSLAAHKPTTSPIPS